MQEICRGQVKISKCKFDLVGVQDMRWDRRGTEPEDEYIIFLWKGERGP
jgi:hypothetical protein